MKKSLICTTNANLICIKGQINQNLRQGLQEKIMFVQMRM
jgi:hypothetical protein